MDNCLHTFDRSVGADELPRLFTCPFCYEPHPLVREAAASLGRYLSGRGDWTDELNGGKMFGVLIVEDSAGTVGFLAAFSGLLAGDNHHDYFVPPVYDLLRPDGYFKQEEACISDMNRRINALEASTVRVKAREAYEKARREAAAALERARTEAAERKARRQVRRQAATEAEKAGMIRESQFDKAELRRLRQRLDARVENARQEVETFEAVLRSWRAERHRRSAALQQRLFDSYQLLSARGQTCSLYEVFRREGRIPPGGAGECAAPKLLQYAYLHQLRPVAMGEFWWGRSPQGEVRHHGHFYPSCKSKCEPILRFMLDGLAVEPNPLVCPSRTGQSLTVVYEDEWLLAVGKPAGLLSVDGTMGLPSVESELREMSGGKMLWRVVHRLDQDTSGLLLVAKDAEALRRMQAMFAGREVMKEYEALLDGQPRQDAGYIDLPLAPDWDDRPRQMVDREHGKPAQTGFRVLTRGSGWARVRFEPLSGRTHQIRLHAAHSDGLGAPIRGDRLYGYPADRLYLHAARLVFRHPMTGRQVDLRLSVPF